jgi:putative DNA primase/helicase
MRKPYKDAAQVYRSLGLLGALPLPPGEKNPPPKGYTGSGRPYPTDNEVAQWVNGKGRDLLPIPYDPRLGNIALRLGDVPSEVSNKRADLPVVYAGNNVDGWEYLGLDVDDYGEKHGLADLRELETEYGVLPRTAISSARWDGWLEHRSGIRVFLVPKGFRYMGKAAHGIDIVQKRHRFMVAHPSTNPDANNALYAWRFGATDDESLYAFDVMIPGYGDMYGIPDPSTDDVAVLPVEWFTYLSRGGTVESEDPISSLSDDELIDWLKTLRFEEEPCERMRKATAKWIERLEESASSHDKLVPAHHELLNLAAEGHAGIEWALNEFHPAWWGHVSENRGGDPESAGAEINRSIVGGLDKIQPYYEGLGRPEDTCAVDASDYNVDGWAERVEAAVSDMDYEGLGPIVGAMEVLDAKPASEYGQHDDGNGQHFIDLYGGSVKYVDGRDGWVVWDSKRWHRDNSSRKVGLAFRRVRMRQEEFAYRTLAEAKANDDKGLMALGKSWLTWSKRSGNVGPISAALQSAERLHVNGEDVAVPTTLFDSRPDLLGCENGVLELTADPEIRKPEKHDYVTFNTGTPYVPWRTLASSEGETFEGFELWNEYLNTFLPDRDVQRYIQKVMGHLIIGENPEKRIVFLYGPHDTGKSTMIGAISGALGDYYGTVDIALFRPKELNPGLIRAVPLRVVGMSEVDAGTMDAATVKRLTGNDKVNAEAKYSNDIFEGRPQFTCLIAANNPPNIAHADEALNERLLALPFMKTIERSHRRYDRQNQIEKHSGVAVLSWMVEGWKMYCAEGLDNPPIAIRKLQREMTAGLNATQGFISEMLEKARDTEEGRRAIAEAEKRAKRKGKVKATISDMDVKWTTPCDVVYETYKRWCNGNGVDPVSHPELTKDLGLGAGVARSIDGKVRKCYNGIRVRDFEVGGKRVK